MSSALENVTSTKEVSESGNEKPQTNGDVSSASKDKKSSTKENSSLKSSSKKRRRSRSRSRKRSTSKGRRSRSRHKSPKRRRSPARKRRSRSRDKRSKSRDKRSKSRDRRSRSRDRRRRRSRSKERRSRRSRSRNRKRRRSRSSSKSSSGSSGDEKDKSKSKNEASLNSKKDKDEKKSDSKDLASSKMKQMQKKESKQEKKLEHKERKRSRSPDHRRRRSRSRSHKRRRRRSRSKERRRSRDRSRRSPSPHSRSRRSRSRKRSRSRDRDKNKSTSEKEKKASKFTDVDPLSKDFEQAKLEEEMNKRRERVEKWRKEQKNKSNKSSENAEDENGKPRKVWSLEDDDDDDEEVLVDADKNDTNEASEDKEDSKEDKEVDPLDAFMMELSKDKNKEDNIENGNENSNGPKVSRISAVATKSKPNKALRNKGELMEGNMDAMEYSSEEEEESLDKAFSKYQNKQQPKKLETEVDHSKINYESFRKNFYVEVPELAALTPEEVEEMRMNMENIRIRGKNCPKPIQSWVQAGVSYKMLSALKKANYEKPTIIQAQAIPAIMSGSDLIGIAKTGSGKTVAFLLPMFRQIMDQRPLENGEGPIAVVMTPTRELALQITKECKKFSKPLKLRAVCVYGGTGISEQIADLKRGAEIIVCTPGRMIDMLTVNSGRVTNLRRCTYLVLDEADRMFDMGFEPQVMHVIKSCRPDRQTVLFSATFPRQMEALARRILNKPIEVQVGGRSVVCSDVSQEVIILSEEQKYLKLLELLGQYQELGAVLVFVDKQERADSLLKDLMGSSYSCMALHGGIDQYDRDSIINDFKTGVNRLLIATSVAARGLDVKNLILVVNYSCPNHYEDYVHRCGRTGRAGKKGTAVTFITEEQARYSGEIIKALELSGTKVPGDLENLWSKFKEEQQSQGKSVKSNSGFSGRGFKFDETEEAMARERKQIQKAALGLEDSDDEEPAQNIDEKIESMFNSKKTVKDVSTPLGSLLGASGGATTGPGANKAKLDVAKRLASRINMQKNLGAGAQDVMQQAATALMKGGVFAGPKVSAKTIAEQLAEKINQKLNYVPQEKPDVDEEEEDNTLKRYEEELEINDFPQTCRWKVTSKDTLLQICEYSEAGITIRGQYFPPGKQPGEEDRKLYLAIEAVSELAVQKAKNEITRLIKEELIRLQNSYQPISKNRYKVM